MGSRWRLPGYHLFAKASCGTPFSTAHFVAMPRYFFNIREGDQVVIDEEGMSLPGIDAAIAEAEQSGRELLVDLLRDGAPLDGQLIEITAEDGTVIRQVGLKSLFWIGA